MKRIKQLREALGMSQTDLADELGTSKQNVSNLERAEHLPPCVRIAVGLLALLPVEQRDKYIKRLRAIPRSRSGKARKKP